MSRQNSLIVHIRNAKTNDKPECQKVEIRQNKPHQSEENTVTSAALYIVKYFHLGGVVHLCPYVHHPAGCQPSNVCLAGAEVTSTHTHLCSHSYNYRKENTNILVELPNSSSHLCRCRTVTTFLLVIVIISDFQVLGSPPSLFKQPGLLVGAFTTEVLYNVMPSILRTQQSLVFSLLGQIVDCTMPVFKL